MVYHVGITNLSCMLCILPSLVTKASPIALAKGIKNEVELEGMRAAHVRDGVAMVKALSRLEHDVAAGECVSEVDVDKRTTAERAAQDKFVGEDAASWPLLSQTTELAQAGSSGYHNDNNMARIRRCKDCLYCAS